MDHVGHRCEDYIKNLSCRLHGTSMSADTTHKEGRGDCASIMHASTTVVAQTSNR